MRHAAQILLSFGALILLQKNTALSSPSMSTEDNGQYLDWKQHQDETDKNHKQIFTDKGIGTVGASDSAERPHGIHQQPQFLTYPTKETTKSHSKLEEYKNNKKLRPILESIFALDQNKDIPKVQELGQEIETPSSTAEQIQTKKDKSQSIASTKVTTTQQKKNAVQNLRDEKDVAGEDKERWDPESVKLATTKQKTHAVHNQRDGKDVPGKYKHSWKTKSGKEKNRTHILEVDPNGKESSLRSTSVKEKNRFQSMQLKKSHNKTGSYDLMEHQHHPVVHSKQTATVRKNARSTSHTVGWTEKIRISTGKGGGSAKEDHSKVQRVQSNSNRPQPLQKHNKKIHQSKILVENRVQSYGIEDEKKPKTDDKNVRIFVIGVDKNENNGKTALLEDHHEQTQKPQTSNQIIQQLPKYEDVNEKLRVLHPSEPMDKQTQRLQKSNNQTEKMKAPQQKPQKDELVHLRSMPDHHRKKAKEGKNKQMNKVDKAKIPTQKQQRPRLLNNQKTAEAKAYKTEILQNQDAKKSPTLEKLRQVIRGAFYAFENILITLPKSRVSLTKQTESYQMSQNTKSTPDKTVKLSETTLKDLDVSESLQPHAGSNGAKDLKAPTSSQHPAETSGHTMIIRKQLLARDHSTGKENSTRPVLRLGWFHWLRYFARPNSYRHRKRRSQKLAGVECSNDSQCLHGQVCDKATGKCKLGLNGNCRGSGKSQCKSGTFCDWTGHCRIGVDEKCNVAAMAIQCPTGAFCVDSMCRCTNHSMVFRHICEPRTGWVGASCIQPGRGCTPRGSLCVDGICTCSEGTMPYLDFDCLRRTAASVQRSSNRKGMSNLLVGSIIAGVAVICAVALFGTYRYQKDQADKRKTKKLSTQRDAVERRFRRSVVERDLLSSTGAEANYDQVVQAADALAGPKTSVAEDSMLVLLASDNDSMYSLGEGSSRIAGMLVPQASDGDSIYSPGEGSTIMTATFVAHASEGDSVNSPEEDCPIMTATFVPQASNGDSMYSQRRLPYHDGHFI